MFDAHCTQSIVFRDDGRKKEKNELQFMCVHNNYNNLCFVAILCFILCFVCIFKRRRSYKTVEVHQLNLLFLLLLRLHY